MSMTQQPPGPEGLEWFSIDDFSPGIVQRKNHYALTSANPAPLGAAQAEDTYRCVALPGGGLGPLPKRHYNYSHATIGDGTTRYNTGFMVMGPIIDVVGANTANVMEVNDQSSGQLDEFILGYSYNANPNYTRVVEAIQAWLAVPSVLTLTTTTSATRTDVHGAHYMTPARHSPTGTTPISDDVALVALAWERPLSAAALTFSSTLLYPFPGAATPYANVGIVTGYLVGHQARVVAALKGTEAWAGKSYYDQARLVWTTPYRLASRVTSDFLNVGPETPFGIGCMSSLSASDLLVIKHRGGAYLIQGDLTYPIIRHLPGVTGTGGTECYGANSSLGFVYGVNQGGVRVWQGGEGSEQLAPQLEPNFWITPDWDPVYQYKGRFAEWGDYIIAPNNWLFDTVTKGWWRLETPAEAVYTQFVPSPSNNVLYGSRATWTDASPIVVSGWDPSTPASSYSWKSQPLPLTFNRRVTVREIQVVAQGVGDITLSVIGSTSDQSKNIVWTLPAEAATHPVLLRKKLSWQGSYVQLQLGSYHSSTGPAPIINAIRGAYHTDQQVAESGEFF